MDSNLLTEAINLTLFGMGFVFVFLAVMVVVTNLMSRIVLKIQPAINFTESSTASSTVEIDNKTRAIIEAAIRMHFKN
jgi:oxaloacetate decarboxylase gamma subunit